MIRQSRPTRTIQFPQKFRNTNRNRKRSQLPIDFLFLFSDRVVRTPTSGLMRHQDRNDRRFEGTARDTAQQYFAKTRVAIAAHHNQVRRELGCEQ